MECRGNSLGDFTMPMALLRMICFSLKDLAGLLGFNPAYKEKGLES